LSFLKRKTGEGEKHARSPCTHSTSISLFYDPYTPGIDHPILGYGCPNSIKALMQKVLASAFVQPGFLILTTLPVAISVIQYRNHLRGPL
jgi:hypothetical protein